MATKKTPTKKGRNKPKESKGMSRGTRAVDWEKHIAGSDKSPIEQKKVAGNKLKAKVPLSAKAKVYARSAGRYLKRGGGLAGMATIGAASYLGSKIGEAAAREKETRSKLEKDARNEKPKSSGAKTTSAPKRTTSAPEKKYTSELYDVVETKGGGYARYKKGSSGAKDFQKAYGAAKAGTTFTWRGRKYKKP